jgi:hypothetical protein
LIQLTAADLNRINPNTKNLPMFASPTDAKITAAIHRQVPILHAEEGSAGNLWRIAAGRMFHMSGDADLFHSAGDLDAQGGSFDGFAWMVDGRRYLPLHEGKHVWHYDHRYATSQGMPQDSTRSVTIAEHDLCSFEIETRHYVVEAEVNRKLRHRTDSPWLIGWRDISSPTNQRTLILSVIPRTAAGHKLPLLQPHRAGDSVALVAALGAMPCDYTLRQKSSGANVSKFMLNQAPVPHPDTFAAAAPWQPECSLQEWLHPRVLELSYTSWSVQPWAVDVGDDGPPFRWGPERRAVLQAEIDGAMFPRLRARPRADRPRSRHLPGAPGCRDSDVRRVPN